MRRFLSLLCAAFLLIAGAAHAATLNATPSTFAAQVSASSSGDTILLATGSYGTWSGTSKAITIKADAGAAATMSPELSTGDANFTLDGLTLNGDSDPSGEIDIDNDVHDVTIRNSTITDTVKVTGDRSGPLLFDNVHFDAHVSDCAGGCLPALWIGPGGTAHDTKIVVRNSLFTHSPGDGIQAGSAFTVTDSEFHVTNDGACDSCHTDSIQLFGGQADDGTGSTILRDYIHDGGTDSDGIVEFDGGGHHDIEDNVIAREQLFGMDLGNDSASKVIHNTIVMANSRTGIDMTSKNTPGSSGETIRDNVIPSIEFTGGGCNCTATPAAYDHNLIPGASSPNIAGAPTFVGGSSPTTYAGFALASGSAGKGAASDGLDAGARIATGPTTFVSDTFTDSAPYGTPLTSHTGETGATWTAHPSSTGATQTSASGGIRETTTTGVGVYYASGLPPSANYTVEADFLTRAAWASDYSAYAHVLARVDTTATTFYACRYSKVGHAWEIAEWNAGTGVIDASTSATLAPSTTYHVAFTVNGPSLSCKVNGSTVVSATDSTITAAGRVGVRLINNPQAYSSGIHVDNLTATG